MGLILDTSVLIAAERGKLDLPGLFEAHEDDAFFLAAITVAELLHGVERADTPERRSKRSRFVESVLSEIPAIEFGVEIAREHARLWARLESAGAAIGPYDMLIAATCVVGKHRLATLNRAEFARVEGIVLVEVDRFIPG